MATLTYYTFSKRSKSTAQPTGGTQITVNLKGGTSLISPVFLLNFSSVPSFNYVSFEGRYYFVNDIRSIRQDLWEISCTEDYLATGKADIGSTTAMIMYATGGSNDIIDQRIGVKSTVRLDSAQSGLNGFIITDTGNYLVVLSIVGVGSFGTYILENQSDLPLLLNNLSVWGQTNITDEITALRQFVEGGNAVNNLKAALGIPIILGDSTGLAAASQLVLGKYPCADMGGNAINGRRIINPITSAQATVSIPWHYSDWRRRAPYSKVYLYIPFIGMVNVPSDEIINSSSLHVYFALNICSGDLSIQIRETDSSGRLLATCSTNIAISTPFGSSNVSGAKVMSSVGVGIASVAAVMAGTVTGGAATLALGGGLAASAGGLISALGGETGGGGGLGGGASQGLDKVVHCYVVSHELTDSQASVNPIIGKPVMAKHQINSYSGFIQTDGMQVAGNLLDIEREAINSLCDGGFYYE